MAQNKRAKHGYLSYNDMLAKIEAGQLDAYDIVYTKDTKECIVITPELLPSPIKSRVYVFDNVADAEQKLNEYTDTYVGQIVRVLSQDKYVGYIVNRSGGAFYVTPLCEYQDEIDYNTIGNKPIVNLTGTIDEPVQLSALEDGTYSVIGQYKVDNNDETIYLSASSTICMVEHKDSIIHIKTINSFVIYDYAIENQNVTRSAYLTESYLADNGYVTEQYVDEKILALDFMRREDVEEYVNEKLSQIVEVKFTEVIDQKIDEKIDEKMVEVWQSIY